MKKHDLFFVNVREFTNSKGVVTLFFLIIGYYDIVTNLYIVVSTN